MDPRTRQRSAIARQVGSLLLSPDFRDLFSRTKADDQALIIVLPDDTVEYMLERAREYPGGVTVLMGDDDGLSIMYVGHSAEEDRDMEVLRFVSLQSDMAMLVEFGRQQRGRTFRLDVEDDVQVELVNDSKEDALT